jgi:hypothetical protein
MKSDTEDRLLSGNQCYHRILTSPYNLLKRGCPLRQPLTESIEVKKNLTRNTESETINLFRFEG